MIRRVFALPGLVFAFYLLLPASGSVFEPAAGPASAAADVMQCMESCIRHEGGNSAANKETCKARCANVPSVTGGAAPENRDSGSCMSAYKDCQENCGKDKKCQRVCKKALMRCQ